jgi:hypothetical protein
VPVGACRLEHQFGQHREMVGADEAQALEPAEPEFRVEDRDLRGGAAL